MRAFLTGPFGTWELDQGTTTIGRGSICTIQIKDRRLSRRHIEIRFDGDELVVKDLGSSNGTLVNGDTVYGERALGNRDLLIFGPVACDVYLGEHSFTNLPVIQLNAKGRAVGPVARSPQAGLRPPSDPNVDEDRMATEPGGHETLPDPERPPSSGYTRQRTEAMDPDAITSLFPQNLPIDSPDINNPTTKQALTTRRRSPKPLPVDPAIRDAIDDQSRQQAVSQEGRPPKAKPPAEAAEDDDEGDGGHSTDRLNPDHSSAGTNSSALQPLRDYRHNAPVHATAPDDEQRQISTDIAKPHNQLEERQRAIETNTSHRRKAVSSALRRRVALTGMRSLAGMLDGLQFASLALLAGAPWLIGGYIVALLEAGAATRIRDGLPHFAAIEPVATWSDILASLTTPAGWSQMVSLTSELREHSQQAFLAFFVGCVLTALALVLVLLMALIAPTSYRGGPFWHRRCGLVIVERRNGYFPTPVRSCLRWITALLLLPLAPLLLLAGQRGAHDLLCGCEVRHRLYSLTPSSSGSATATPP